MTTAQRLIAAFGLSATLGIAAVAQEADPNATARARPPGPVCKPFRTGQVRIQNLYCDDNPEGCTCPCNAMGGCKCDRHNHCVPLQLE